MLLKEIKTYFIKKILIKLILNIYKGIYQMKKGRGNEDRN